MNHIGRKAFTLVELLIVIGIIGLLAVTVLLALNPAEAQRKSRDTKRIRDASTIQAALEQVINEGVTVPTGAGTLGNGGVTSSALTSPYSNVNVTSQNCTSGSHWLGAIDLCPYIKTVPLDPQNGTLRNYQNGAGATVNGVMYYRAVVVDSGCQISRIPA
ncbi:MAG: type II secretion system protein [Caldilineaceae bacterium]|nr:type II secretion system protein [Caldilineaceae bacterium]